MSAASGPWWVEWHGFRQLKCARHFAGRVIKVPRVVRAMYGHRAFPVGDWSPPKFFDKYGYYTIRKYDSFNKRQQLKRRTDQRGHP